MTGLLSLCVVASVLIPAGNPAPQLEGQTLDGQPWADPLTGQVTIVEFFATWCPHCRRSLAGYHALAAARQVRLIIVDVGEEPALVQAFFARNPPPPNAGVLLDPTDRAREIWGVTGYPAAYLIDQKGIIRMAFSGWGEETARKWYEGPPFASEIVHDGRTASLFDPGARTFLPLDGSVSLPERTGRLAMPTLDRTAYLAFRNREEDHERVLPIAGTENVLLVQEEPRLPIDSPARTQTKTIHLRVV